MYKPTAGAHCFNAPAWSNDNAHARKRQEFDKSKLPQAKEYYRSEFSDIAADKWKNKKKILVSCVFHKENTPSLALNLETGAFFCHACHEKGGDVLEFHRKHNKLSFWDAVKQLGAIR